MGLNQKTSDGRLPHKVLAPQVKSKKGNDKIVKLIGGQCSAQTWAPQEILAQIKYSEAVDWLACDYGFAWANDVSTFIFLRVQEEDRSGKCQSPLQNN